MCVFVCKVCVWGVVVRGDTDLPLINTDGDQGERQDDEDWSSHINHPSSGLACLSKRVYRVHAGAYKSVLVPFLTEVTLRFTG